MRIRISFYSYFKDLTGCAFIEESFASPGTVQEVVSEVYARFPKLKPFEKSTLIAVGVEYQTGSYRLQDGDEIALFPPVQGG